MSSLSYGFSRGHQAKGSTGSIRRASKATLQLLALGPVSAPKDVSKKETP